MADVGGQPDARIRTASASVKVSLSLSRRQPARCIFFIHETRGQRKVALCRLESTRTSRAHVMRLSERADVRNDACLRDGMHMSKTMFCAKKIGTRAEHVEKSCNALQLNLCLCAATATLSSKLHSKNARAARLRDMSPHSVSVHE